MQQVPLRKKSRKTSCYFRIFVWVFTDPFAATYIFVVPCGLQTKAFSLQCVRDTTVTSNREQTQNTWDGCQCFKACFCVYLTGSDLRLKHILTFALLCVYITKSFFCSCFLAAYRSRGTSLDLLPAHRRALHLRIWYLTRRDLSSTLKVFRNLENNNNNTNINNNNN